MSSSDEFADLDEIMRRARDRLAHRRYQPLLSNAEIIARVRVGASPAEVGREAGITADEVRLIAGSWTGRRSSFPDREVALRPGRKRWTQEEDDAIRSGRDRGESWSIIAAAIGSSGGTVYMRGRDLGLSGNLRPSHQQRSEHYMLLMHPRIPNEEIYQLRLQGMTYKEIGLLADVSASRVGQILKKMSGRGTPTLPARGSPMLPRPPHPSKRIFTTSDDEIIRVGRRQRKSWDSIAKDLGTSPTTVRKRAKEIVCAESRPSDEQIYQMVMGSGRTARDVALEVGLSMVRVREIVQRINRERGTPRERGHPRKIPHTSSLT